MPFGLQILFMCLSCLISIFSFRILSDGLALNGGFVIGFCVPFCVNSCIHTVDCLWGSRINSLEHEDCIDDSRNIFNREEKIYFNSLLNLCAFTKFGILPLIEIILQPTPKTLPMVGFVYFKSKTITLNLSSVE